MFRKFLPAGAMMTAFASVADVQGAVAQSAQPASEADARRSAVSADDISAIRSRIASHWLIPRDVTIPEGAEILIRTELAPGGQVLSARALIPDQPNDDLDFAVLLRSAERAVLRAGPLPVPDAHYDQWRVLTLSFAPSTFPEKP